MRALHGDAGVVTAASASQVSDGAAALLICNEEGLKKLGNFLLRERTRSLGRPSAEIMARVPQIFP